MIGTQKKDMLCILLNFLGIRIGNTTESILGNGAWLSASHSEHKIDNIKQLYNGDCGIACLRMVLGYMNYSLSGALQQEVLRTHSSLRRIWTVDLAYILKALKLEPSSCYILCTQTMHITRQHPDMEYFRANRLPITAEVERVNELYQSSSRMDIKIEQTVVSTACMRDLVLTGRVVAIALVDMRLLTCTVCAPNGKSSRSDFVGHFIVLCGLVKQPVATDDGSSDAAEAGTAWCPDNSDGIEVFVYKDPAPSACETCFTSNDDLDYARQSPGTDFDLLLIRLGDRDVSDDDDAAAADDDDDADGEEAKRTVETTSSPLQGESSEPVHSPVIVMEETLGNRQQEYPPPAFSSISPPQHFSTSISMGDGSHALNTAPRSDRRGGAGAVVGAGDCTTASANSFGMISNYLERQRAPASQYLQQLGAAVAVAASPSPPVPSPVVSPAITRHIVPSPPPPQQTLDILQKISLSSFLCSSNSPPRERHHFQCFPPMWAAVVSLQGEIVHNSLLRLEREYLGSGVSRPRVNAITAIVCVLMALAEVRRIADSIQATEDGLMAQAQTMVAAQAASLMADAGAGAAAVAPSALVTRSAMFVRDVVYPLLLREQYGSLYRPYGALLMSLQTLRSEVATQQQAVALATRAPERGVRDDVVTLQKLLVSVRVSSCVGHIERLVDRLCAEVVGKVQYLRSTAGGATATTGSITTETRQFRG